MNENGCRIGINPCADDKAPAGLYHMNVRDFDDDVVGAIIFSGDDCRLTSFHGDGYVERGPIAVVENFENPIRHSSAIARVPGEEIVRDKGGRHVVVIDDEPIGLWAVDPRPPYGNRGRDDRNERCEPCRSIAGIVLDQLPHVSSLPTVVAGLPFSDFKPSAMRKGAIFQLVHWQGKRTMKLLRSDMEINENTAFSSRVWSPREVVDCLSRSMKTLTNWGGRVPVYLCGVLSPRVGSRSDMKTTNRDCEVGRCR